MAFQAAEFPNGSHYVGLHRCPFGAGPEDLMCGLTQQ
jgi:hypothetical protein